MKQSLPQIVHLDREICGTLELAEQHEWWLANGKGGYAGGTVAGTLTRRYHGLLIAPFQSHLQRNLLFAKADAELLDGDRVIHLHTNRWGSGVVEPRGHLSIESFRLDGRMPVWHYRLDDLLIEARIWMEHGRHSTSIAWRLLENPAERGVKLRVRLLANVRDHHGITGFENSSPSFQTSDHELDISYPGCPTLHFHSRCGEVQRADYWIEDFDLPAERERGLSSLDRHLCVGHMTFPIHAGHWVGLTASIEEDEPAYYMEDSMRRFQARDLAMLTRAKITVPELMQAPAWIDQLILAADSFVIRHEQDDIHARDAIVAGYPWFGEWGRDSMIALPGLLLATGRYQQARSLLLGHLPLVDGGMLPNFFPGNGEAPQYNTVDAALWFIEAWHAYFSVIKDLPSLAYAWPILQQIIGHYRNGTRHGIGMDPSDGLLCAGETGMQLTWMDARVGDNVITPRIGKPVEINALWYNALQTMEYFAHILNDEARAKEYSAMAAKTRAEFRRFVRSKHNGLFDVIDGPDGNDDDIRPNQILAVSLTFTPLDSQARQDVVAVCAQHLLTPFGLRSLDSASPDYRPYYQGDVWSRDSAYHQGTVWAWLLGHYALAEYRVSGNAERALSRLEGMQDHLNKAGLGTVSEIFDGDAPHTARGCPAQAWSVACTLDAWLKLRRAQSKNEKEDRHEQAKSVA
ncbi:amylo-alpha-1,6-glucosidase [Sideroxydans sp. CL21]|uniref:amylo-alpha-1,6-glucosidase n=1 Tax=Sideroxydans sp. CL21 TaxID=2600596 RepID=UPI0024BCEC6C|nr:amylo-alpha-1,6-glucosidase [Sideroxydans sp. CL21]